MRSVIIPERIFDAEHISSAVREVASGIDDAGASCEYLAAIEARSAVSDVSNRGKLKPVAFGKPDTDVNVDLLIRTAGNADGARFAQKDSTKTIYKGKTPTHIPHDVKFLEYSTSAASRPHRPKLLPLASGELLLVYLYPESGSGAVKWRTYDPTTNVFSAITEIELGNVTYTGLLTADVVQMADGELILMVLAYGSSNEVILFRLTSVGDTNATIVWEQSVIEYQAIDPTIGGSTYSPTGMSIEVLNNERICMLMHVQGTGLTNDYMSISRSYSDDRGLTWVPWAAATTYPEMPDEVIIRTGGVDITKLRTGALMAVVGVVPSNPADSFPAVLASLLCLVSDDGDTWGSVIRWANSDDAGVTSNGESIDYPLAPEGVQEGAVVVGDDGLPRVMACFHGDPEAPETEIYGDIALLTFRRPDITGSDVAPAIPSGESILFSDKSCTDVLEANFNPNTGLYVPSASQKSLHRAIALTGAGPGSGSLYLTTPDFGGIRSLAVANYRGALWVVGCWELTTPGGGGVQYALGFYRCNVWSELNERPSDVANDAIFTRGFVYTSGFMAYATPTQLGKITVVGPASQSLDATTGGLKINGSIVSNYDDYPLGISVKARPTLGRFKVLPVSGGSLTADNIAYRILLTNATNHAGISIRFTTTGFRVVDILSGATLVTVAGLVLTYGIEVAWGFKNYNTLYGVFYKVGTQDPEDGNWVSAGIAEDTTVSTAVAVTEYVSLGAFVATATNATWYYSLFGRGTTSSGSGTLLNLLSGVQAYDVATPTYPEFEFDRVSFDDGLRHGLRAPKCNAVDFYLRKNLRIAWRGTSARVKDLFSLKNGYATGVERLVSEPVLSYWRSEDDDSEVNIVFDAGSSGHWKPDAMALFKINAAIFTVDFDDAVTFDSAYGGVPSLSFLISPDDAADVRRNHYYRETNYSVYANTLESTVVLTADSDQPLSPHQYRSDDKVQWFLWADTEQKAYKVTGNDAYRIFLEGNATVLDGFFIYCDKIAFNLSGGALSGSGAGYRYMRIRLSENQIMAGDLQADNTFSGGYFTIGLIISGQKWDLADPHPEWDWQRQATYPLESVKLSNRSDWTRLVLDGALETWTMAFTGLLDRPVRTTLAVNPGTRGGFMCIRDMLNACMGGEKIVALLPEYNDGVDGTMARSLDVYPVKVFGPWSLRQKAYEGCRSSGGSNDIDGTIKAIGDLEALTFAEIF